MRRLGVEVRLSVTAKRWSPDIGLEYDDGVVLTVDGVVVATGVRVQAGLARRAGIAVQHEASEIAPRLQGGGLTA